MDFAQLRAVKAALVAMCAVALLVSGCAAPKSEDKQRTATLTGTVVDVQGSPIPGARVSTTAGSGVNLVAPVAVADATGQFTVTDLPANTNVTVTAQAPGFVGGAGTRVDSSGNLTKQIAIVSGANSGVTIVLDRGGATQRVGPNGDTIKAAVPGSVLPAALTTNGQAPVVLASFPQGSVPVDTDISVNPIPASALREAPPTGASGGAPAVLLGDQQSTSIPRGVVAAVQLLPDGLQFADGLQPVIDLPLPFTLSQLPAGTKVPVLTFDEAKGQWVTGAIATIVADPVDNAGLAVARFTVSHFSEYIITAEISFTFGAATTVGHADFPVVTGKPYTRGLINSLVWDPPTTLSESALLEQAFGAATGFAGNFVEPIAIPPAQAWDLRQWPVTGTVVFKDQAGTVFANITRHGTRDRWFRTSVTIPSAPTVPPLSPHLQGHIQGGGTGG